jgi:hypothetical protein
MKFLTPVLLALVASSQAAFCNGGWGLPSRSSCPSPYVSTVQLPASKKPPTDFFVEKLLLRKFLRQQRLKLLIIILVQCQHPGAPNPTFPTFRTCVYPSRGGRPALDSCNGAGVSDKSEYERKTGTNSCMIR